MTIPPDPNLPPPELVPGVPEFLVINSFAGIPFSWVNDQPTFQHRDGLETYSGQIIVYHPQYVYGLQNVWRPVTITQCGEGQNVYVDYWGPDPSAEFVYKGQLIAAHAILSEFSQQAYQFYRVPDPIEGPNFAGVARCQITIIIADPAADTGGGGGGGGGGDGNGSSQGDGTIQGTTTAVLAPSDSVNVQCLNLWNGETNDEEPTDPDWFDPGYDSGWWPAAAQAFTSGGDFFSGTQPIWYSDGSADGQRCLFRHAFDVPAVPAGLTVAAVQLDVLVSNCTIDVWFNGSMLISGISPGSPGWAIDVGGNLQAGTANLIAIGADSSSDNSTYISYKLVIVYAGTSGGR